MSARDENGVPVLTSEFNNTSYLVANGGTYQEAGGTQYQIEIPDISLNARNRNVTNILNTNNSDRVNVLSRNTNNQTMVENAEEIN